MQNEECYQIKILDSKLANLDQNKRETKEKKKDFRGVYCWS